MNSAVHPDPIPVATGQLKLRPAAPSDFDLLNHWHRQPQVVAANGDDWGREAELAGKPDWRTPLIAEADGRPVGVIQIIDPTRGESHNWGCAKEGQRAIDIRIGNAVELDQAYGAEIMKLAIKLCFADPSVTAVLVDPPVNDPRAQRFYERFGFEYVARRRFGEDDSFVYRLKRPVEVPATAPNTA
ncbi:MAG: GNAT family N-acetyltransferase [Dongiaceae bacterium]